MEVDPADDGKGKKGAAGGGGDGPEWGLERQFVFEREMLLMAATDAPGAQPQKLTGRGRGRRPFAADLLQNCDLPPPAKLFGPVPTLQRLESAAGADLQKADTDAAIGGGGGGDKDSLLRALRLSQSRAREAEEKLAAAGAGSGDLAALLVRDSVALSAHRRWVMMLEAENSLIRGGGASRGAEPDPDDADADDVEVEAAARRGGGVAAWWVALAVCVGLAIGRYLF